MASEKTPRKIELVFFRNERGGEPVRDWLRSLDEAERRAIGTDLLRAQWRWPVAVVPANGKRLVGGTNRFAGQPHGARFDLLLPRPTGGPAWIYQENASHARGCFSVGSQATEG